MRIIAFILCLAATSPAWGQSVSNNNDFNTQINLLKAIQQQEAELLANSKLMNQELEEIKKLLKDQQQELELQKQQLQKQQLQIQKQQLPQTHLQ